MIDNIMHHGLEISVSDKATKGLNKIGTQFSKLTKNVNQNARQMEQGITKTLSPFQSMSEQLNQEIVSGTSGLSSQHAFDRFQQNLRQQVNQYHHMIMGGVALSMSGMGIQRAGQNIRRTIEQWSIHAEDFNRTMEEMRFLGQLTEEEYESLGSTIQQVGIEMPVSVQEAAEGSLAAMKMGYDSIEAEMLAEPIAQLQFFSQGAMDARSSMEFLNAIIKETGKPVSEVDNIMDQLAKTMQLTAFSIDEIWRAWRSSRGAFTQLGGDLSEFLTMLGVGRTALTPRFAGRAIRTWAGSVVDTYGRVATGRASDDVKQLWHEIFPDQQEFEEIAENPLDIMYQIWDQKRHSEKFWMEEEGELQALFGRESLALLQQYRNFADRAVEEHGALSAEAMRDIIADSEGFAEEYSEAMMDTTWGLRKVVEGTAETLRIALGEAFEPVQRVTLRGTQKLLEMLLGLTETFPEFTTALVGGTGLVASLMAFGGAAMLIGGQVLSTYGTILNVATQMGTITLTSADTFATAVGKLQGSGITVANLFKVTLLPKILAVGAAIAKVATLVGLLGAAWRYDFLSLRTESRRFLDGITGMFEDANEMRDTLSPVELRVETEGLRRSTGLFDRLTGHLIQLRTVMGSLRSMYSTYRETGDLFIDRDLAEMVFGTDFENLVGQQHRQGQLTPDYLADSLANLARGMVTIIHLTDGFIDGMQQAGGAVRFLFRSLGFFARITLTTFEEVINVMGRFFGIENLTEDMLNSFENIGYVIGRIVGGLLGLKVALKGIAFLLSGMGALLAPFKLIGKLVGMSKLNEFFAGMTASEVRSGGFLKTEMFDSGIAAQQFKRAHEVDWIIQPNMKMSKSIMQRKGIMGALFGSPIFEKTASGAGNIIGFEHGLLTKPLKGVFDMIGMSDMGTKLIDILPTKMATTLVKSLQRIPLFRTGYVMFRLFSSEEGGRLDTVVDSLMQLAGITAGFQLGGGIVGGLGIKGITGLLLKLALGLPFAAIFGALVFTPLGGMFKDALKALGLYDVLESGLGGVVDLLKRIISVITSPMDTLRSWKDRGQEVQDRWSQPDIQHYFDDNQTDIQQYFGDNWPDIQQYFDDNWHRFWFDRIFMPDRLPEDLQPESFRDSDPDTLAFKPKKNSEGNVENESSSTMNVSAVFNLPNPLSGDTDELKQNAKYMLEEMEKLAEKEEKRNYGSIQPDPRRA